MNAHKFVAEKGIEEAKRVLNESPSNAQSYQDGYYFRTTPEFLFHNGHHHWNMTTNNGQYFKERGFDPILISELKQVVDSIDYLNEWYEGKIDGAYDHVERMHGMLKLKPQFPNLHSRINLVERHLANYELVQANKNGDA